MRFPRNLSYNFLSYSFLLESNSRFRSTIVSHSSKVAQVDSKTVEWRLLEPWYRTCMAFFVQLLSSSYLQCTSRRQTCHRQSSPNGSVREGTSCNVRIRSVLSQSENLEDLPLSFYSHEYRYTVYAVHC